MGGRGNSEMSLYTIIWTPFYFKSYSVTHPSMDAD